MKILRVHTRKLVVGLFGSGLVLSFGAHLFAEDPSLQSPSENVEAAQPETGTSWMKAIPVPADPELEAQIVEVQDALSTIDKQIVRRKEALKVAQDPAVKATFSNELELLRKERDNLEALLHDLVDEAKLSQQTAIDEALAHARWLERQQEYWEKKEESIRDRQR